MSLGWACPFCFLSLSLCMYPSGSLVDLKPDGEGVRLKVEKKPHLGHALKAWAPIS